MFEKNHVWVQSLLHKNAAYFFFFSRRVSQNGTDSYTSHGAG